MIFVATARCQGCNRLRHFGLEGRWWLRDAEHAMCLAISVLGWQRIADKWHCPACVVELKVKATRHTAMLLVASDHLMHQLRKPQIVDPS